MEADIKEPLKISFKGKVNIGNKELDCAVLEDGKRILTATSLFKAFDRPRKGKIEADSKPENIAIFAKANNLKPFIQAIFEGGHDYEIKYISKNGNIVYTGYDAEILPLICDVYLTARDEGVLADNQQQLAVIADVLMRSLAKVGITALIDEATGYQEERDADALQKILAKYIAQEFLPWVKTFPDEFYIQMFRLRGWDYKGRFKTPYTGVLTNYLVYERLPEGILDELKKLNPIINGNYRRYRLHQKLSKEHGYRHLENHITSVTTMMRGFDSWDEFDKVFRKSFDITKKLTESDQE